MIIPLPPLRLPLKLLDLFQQLLRRCRRPCRTPMTRHCYKHNKNTSEAYCAPKILNQDSQDKSG